MIVLEFHGAGMVHGAGRFRTTALAPTDLTVLAGETVAVVGRSGAGKTSLAELALGLRTPTSGRISVAGRPWSAPGVVPSRDRRGLVQGVPQDAQATLPPRWSVETTLRTTARRLLGHARDANLADDDIDRIVGRAMAAAQCDPDLLPRRPHQLSGGQAQRIAIARALVAQPVVIVADEPTSALDASTASRVVETLFELARTAGIALVVVTHDQKVADRCDRILRISDGRVLQAAS